MRDDDKMFNIGFAMSMGMVFLIIFLQVCYRVQNANLADIREKMNNTYQKYSVAETKFSTLKSDFSLRSSLDSINKNLQTVSSSKTVNVDDIPMVGE